RVSIVEPAAARLLDGLALSAVEIKQRGAALLDELLLAQHGHASNFNRAAGEVERLCAQPLVDVDGIDPTLEGTVERGRRHLAVTLEKLRTKSAAALARRDSELKRQVESSAERRVG